MSTEYLCDSASFLIKKINLNRTRQCLVYYVLDDTRKGSRLMPSLEQTKDDNIIWSQLHQSVLVENEGRSNLWATFSGKKLFNRKLLARKVFPKKSFTIKYIPTESFTKKSSNRKSLYSKLFIEKWLTGSHYFGSSLAKNRWTGSHWTGSGSPKCQQAKSIFLLYD